MGKTFLGSPKPAGTDNHAHTPERGARNVDYVDCIFDARGASEALKLSRHWNIFFNRCLIMGGLEDNFDMVRGGYVTFQSCMFKRNGAEQNVTIKGSAKYVFFGNCTGLEKVVLGQYTKYDLKAYYPNTTVKKASLFNFARPPTREVIFQRCGKPSVVCWHADAPIGDVRVTKLPDLLVRTFFYFRSKFKEGKPPAPEEFALTEEEL